MINIQLLVISLCFWLTSGRKNGSIYSLYKFGQLIFLIKYFDVFRLNSSVWLTTYVPHKNPSKQLLNPIIGNHIRELILLISIL